MTTTSTRMAMFTSEQKMGKDDAITTTILKTITSIAMATITKMKANKFAGLSAGLLVGR